MPQFNPVNYEGLDRLSHAENFLASRIETAQRQQLAWNARGLLTESFFPGNLGQTTSPSIARASVIGLRAGDTVNNVVSLMTSEGGTQVIVKNCVWDTAGNLLAATANLSTAFTTTSVAGTYVVGQLSSPYTAPADGAYYAGIVCVGSVSTPKLLSIAINTGIGKQIGTGVRLCVNATAQSDAGTVTWADSTLPFWFGVS